MTVRCLWRILRVLPAVAGLGMVASCRDGEERARAAVLEAGYRFTIGDFLKAAAEGRGAVVEQFLTAGMQVDAVGPRGETALWMAASGAHAYLVQRLLAVGAAADLADLRGVTPMMAAAAAGDVVSVQALRAAGADASRRGVDGLTAMAAAAAAGHAEVVEWLAPQTGGPLEPVLLLACASGHTGVIDGLLKADPGGAGSQLDWSGLLLAAATGGQLPAVQLLSHRLPVGPETAGMLQSVAEVARAQGRMEVAAFLDEEVKRAAPEVAAPEVADLDPSGMGPAAPELEIQSGTPDAAAASLALPSPGPTTVSVMPEASSVPVSLAAVPAGRLGGTRFPKVACDAMPEVPQVLSMVAWEPQTWPVVLKDVADGHGSAEILLTQAPARTVRLRVGDEIPGTGCVIEKLRRRRLYTDATQTVLKNVSELHFRRVATGEVFKAAPEEPVLSNDSAALLRFAGSEREWAAVPGDEFRLGSLLLRVLEIAEAAITMENRLTRETVKVPLTVRP